MAVHETSLNSGVVGMSGQHTSISTAAMHEMASIIAGIAAPNAEHHAPMRTRETTACAAQKAAKTSDATPVNAALAELPDVIGQDGIFRAYTCPGVQTPLTVFPILSGVLTVTTSGSYYLTDNLVATVNIESPNVCLSLNNKIITGRVVIKAAHGIVADGIIRPPAATTNNQAMKAAIEITSGGTNTQLLNVLVSCLALADISDTDTPGSAAGNGGNGGNGIVLSSSGNNLQIKESRIAVLGTGGISRTGGSAGANGKLLTGASSTCPSPARSLCFLCDTGLSAPREFITLIKYHKRCLKNNYKRTPRNTKSPRVNRRRHDVKPIYIA